MTAPTGRPGPPGGRDILAVGREGLDRLPSAERFTDLPPRERHAFLESRRDELYAASSVIAERAMERAWQERSSYPPYGLVRSLFTQMRVVADEPDPYAEGSIDSFVALGRAYMDTVVFYLEREMAALRATDLVWLLGRLEQLLVLFRVDAGPAGQARIRDAFSFLYGGLHFGTSVCVQMVEVMNRMLDGTELTAEQKAAVLGRSTRALYQLTAVNIEDIPSVYQHLHGPSGGPASNWLAADRFAVQTEAGRPRRIDIRPGGIVVPLGRQSGSRGPVAGSSPRPGRPRGAQQTTGGPARYKTRGCPARGSASGGPGAIATLWSWCVELAVETGLIGDG